MRLKICGVFVFVVLTVLSCAHQQYVTFNDRDLFIMGKESFAEGNYEEAREAFEELAARHPKGELGTIASISVADAYYKEEKYVEAVDKYQTFLKLHPTNPLAAWAQYQIGMCYFQQLYTRDRDPSPTKQAKKEFQLVLTNYPYSPFVQDAKQKIEFCDRWLAEHDFLVGYFYYKRGKYKSAIKRFVALLGGYSSKVLDTTNVTTGQLEPREKSDDEENTGLLYKVYLAAQSVIHAMEFIWGEGVVTIPVGQRALYYLACSYEKTGNIDKALELFHLFEKKYPGSKLIGDVRGEIEDINEERGEG